MRVLRVCRRGHVTWRAGIPPVFSVVAMPDRCRLRPVFDTPHRTICRQRLCRRSGRPTKRRSRQFLRPVTSVYIQPDDVPIVSRQRNRVNDSLVRAHGPHHAESALVLEGVDLCHGTPRVGKAFQREAHPTRQAVYTVDADRDTVGRDAAESRRQPDVDHVANAPVHPLGAAPAHAQPPVDQPQGAVQEEAVAFSHQPPARQPAALRRRCCARR